ncbi:MAG TPA: polyhydroxyalkanoate synthesis regulator DNA-binding domain-containing protein [Acidobacteriota bacterium]|nr:polyhydroxyalkanoate synthesis regulator DNA-binding domain-containing protein [Acidobacteriota bacterium]
MARLIKRYANRKLYDATERRYITLEEISEFIQNNEEIQVIDKASGEDITEQVLSKVIAASAQQTDTPISKNVLVSLIQRPSDAVLGYFRKTVSAGFETMNQLDRFVKTLRDMVRYDSTGTATDDLGPALRIVIESFVDDCVQTRLAELHLPQQQEIEKLRQQVQRLERQLKSLQKTSPVAPQTTVATPLVETNGISVTSTRRRSRRGDQAKPSEM